MSAPDLSQKKKLAKELLKSVKALDGDQAARFTWTPGRFQGKTVIDVLKADVKLADAQHVVANDSGFDSWPKMVRYIENLDGDAANFENAVQAVIHGNAEALRTLLVDHPELATQRSTRKHCAVIPHYLAANGVENEHQLSPPNAVEIAEILFAAGGDAVVDATAPIYGGGSGSTPLVALVSSTHPAKAGVQAGLVRAFCRAGAKVDGIEDDGFPMGTALGFRYAPAARALAEMGARIDNLPVAAALGRIDLVERMLDGELPSQAMTFHNPLLELETSHAPHHDDHTGQALVFACMCGERETVEYLLDRGVDIHSGPRNGVTALHETCLQGDLDMLTFLLDRGADPTIRDGHWHSTPLGWSEEGGHPQVRDLIFSRGRFDFLDAVEYRRYDLAEQRLREDPALANAGNGMGLRFAAFHGDLKMLELLLEHGGDPTLANEAGLTARDYAEKNGRTEVVRRLDATGR